MKTKLPLKKVLVSASVLMTAFAGAMLLRLRLKQLMKLLSPHRNVPRGFPFKISRLVSQQ